jgi:hypothetical protein
LVNNIQEGHTCDPARETQLIEKVQGKSVVKVQDDSSVVQKLPSLMNNVVLQKCGTISNKFQCAFCLSSEESEVSLTPLIFFFPHDFPFPHYALILWINKPAVFL